MQIRSYEPKDLPIILTWLRQLQGSSFNWTEESLQSELLHTEAWVLAHPDQGPMAFLCERSLPGSVEWTVLATGPQFLNKGCMSFLLEHRIQALRTAKDVEQIWLEVHEANLGALKLYSKLGFQRVGHRPKYYVDGGGAILFSKTI